MIREIRLQRFKQFSDKTIRLGRRGVTFLAGANNSGKSSVLHAFAVWEFCRTILLAEKGLEAFLPGSKHAGVGLANDDFSPVLIPTLAHLWTNLAFHKKPDDPDGYTLRLRLVWEVEGNGNDRELEFSLSLANDRMFVKCTHSNLGELDQIPKAAYLPPFAGVTHREQRLPEAIRRRRVGEGLSGAVIRNILLDLWERNQAKRQELRGEKTKISNADLKHLRDNDPWELLQQALRSIFGAELKVHFFNEEYHSYIKIEIIRGEVTGFRLKKYPKYKPRDIMAEGSGLLQWIGVYALATNPEIDIVLLDEPDAHLHSSLKRQLITRLKFVATAGKKTVLVATHSSELLRTASPQEILEVSGQSKAKYLKEEQQKVALIEGLGSTYSPRVDAVKQSQRLFFAEGDGDVRILKKVAELAGRAWPEDWVEWVNPSHHKERRHVHQALSEEVAGLRTVSLRDRDIDAISTVNIDLDDLAYPNHPENFYPLKWKRRHIECYCLVPEAIALALNVPVDRVRDRIADEFGLAIPEGFAAHEVPEAILNCNGKEILSRLGVKPIEVIERLNEDQIPEDLIRCVDRLTEINQQEA